MSIASEPQEFCTEGVDFMKSQHDSCPGIN